jgi:hypothetical protein
LSDALTPFRHLARLADKIGRPLGLHLAQFAVIPDKDGTDDRVSIAFLLEDEPPEAPLDPETADAFEVIAEEERKREREEKLEEGKQELAELLKDYRKGIF